MKFGPIPLAEAEGAVLAHAAKLADGRIAKGTRLGGADLERLRTAGLDPVVGARLDEGDLLEDEAAAAIGAGLAGPGIEAAGAATGRTNLSSRANGVLVVDRAVVDRINGVDPAITLATLPEFAPVTAGQMVATVKIIPLAVAASSVEEAGAILHSAAALRLAAYRPHRIALVQTRLPSIKDGVLDKTRRVFASRLEASGSAIIEERRCPHRTGDLTATLRQLPPADLVVIFGASAVIDAEDVIPAAIREAGGLVDHIGMPVDPGNLLLLGRFREVPIIGAPGCARSLKENGFDWILNRLLADLDVRSEDIRRLGVGGLLTEIPTRPQPRLPRGGG